MLLENALLFTIFTHAAGMLAMAALLLPGMPGGTQTDVAARAAYVAANPWLWRIGWFTWQVTALSDLLVCVALIRTAWIPRLPAVLATLVTLAAIVPDQIGQIGWTWKGVTLAQQAVATGNVADYAAFEALVFRLSALWGTIGYLAGAIGWTWCFGAAGLLSRPMRWLSIITWGLFAGITALLFLPEHLRQTTTLALTVSIGNAAAFVLLMIWLVGVTEAVLRRTRPDVPYGNRAPWRHPSAGLPARTCDVVANSRLARAIGRLLPGLVMASDIRDVVYVNYLLEADALEKFVAPPLKLQRLGPDGRYAVFTFLTYMHGHFGPRCFGPLRRFWPSPIQTNWRVHVYNPTTGSRGVQFISTGITSLPHALVTRILADDVPMHIPARAELSRGADGTIRFSIDPGTGSSPDACVELAPTAEPPLGPPWNACFEAWRDVLSYIVPQDRAMTALPESGLVIRQEIDLNIPIDHCYPLAGAVHSRAAAAIAGGATPLCFGVDRVRFRFYREEADR